MVADQVQSDVRIHPRCILNGFKTCYECFHKGVTNHWTGLLNYLTHLFLAFTHSVSIFVMSYCLQVAFSSLNVRTAGRYN